MFAGLGPEYRKLWAASAVSNLGDGITLVAGPLLAASLTRDPALVAGLTFAQRLPWLLFSLLSGALVDRLDRRRLMAAVEFWVPCWPSASGRGWARDGRFSWCSSCRVRRSPS